MPWRRMKHNKSTQIARTLLFVDTETWTADRQPDNLGANSLRFGVVRSGRFVNERGKTVWGRQDSLTFHTQQEFWEYVKSKSRKKETTWIYAHNAGFDFVILGLLEMLADGRMIISKPRKRRKNMHSKNPYYGLLLLEDPPTVIGLEDQDGCRYVICDTLNYWRTSLAAIGKSLGYDKLEMPDIDASDYEWERYCSRDTMVIEKAVIELIEWWRERDLGNWKWTAPGLAMSAFRHKFMDHEIVFHDEQPVRELERDSYFGGQLEAYYIGEINEPVYQLDVVSLYPSVMEHNLYPCKLLDYDLSAKLSAVRPIAKPDYAIAEVEINSDSETFPIRSPFGVTYRRGRGIVTLAGPELAFADSIGAIVKWGRWATYAMEPLFQSYVGYFAQLKDHYERTGDTVKRTFVKLLMNSLYGKFGQYGSTWQINPDRMPFRELGKWFEHNAITNTWVECLGVGNVVLDRQPKREIEQAFPAIASFVTSYARQRMRSFKEICGFGNYYYMSTDSLICNQTGLDRLTAYGGLVGNEMGQLKVEQCGTSATIKGLHWYSIGEKTIEGSKKKSAITTGPNQWTELQFESLMSVIERSKTDLDNRSAIHIKRIAKERHLTYDKGIVGADGWITPHNFQ